MRQGKMLMGAGAIGNALGVLYDRWVALGIAPLTVGRVRVLAEVARRNV
jgi:hypothetical protein